MCALCPSWYLILASPTCLSAIWGPGKTKGRAGRVCQQVDLSFEIDVRRRKVHVSEIKQKSQLNPFLSDLITLQQWYNFRLISCQIFGSFDNSLKWIVQGTMFERNTYHKTGVLQNHQPVASTWLACRQTLVLTLLAKLACRPQLFLNSMFEVFLNLFFWPLNSHKNRFNLNCSRNTTRSLPFDG